MSQVVEPELLNNPEEWVRCLGREPGAQEIAWLKGFRVSQAGNLTRQGWLTDLKAERGPTSLPFLVNIFRRPEGNWTFGIVLDPAPAGKRGRPGDQIYGDQIYGDPYTAALAIPGELKAGGFEISTEPLLASSLRARFQQIIRQRDKEQ